jgi:hypothetical protein
MKKKSLKTIRVLFLNDLKSESALNVTRSYGMIRCQPTLNVSAFYKQKL